MFTSSCVHVEEWVCSGGTNYRVLYVCKVMDTVAL
jgi:hypothetical protein